MSAPAPRPAPRPASRADARPAPVLPDPRPRIVGTGAAARLEGVRCSACGTAFAFARPRCPACAGPVAAASFGPGGTVWSATVVRIPVPGRTPPYGLAYVDLDDGPRILAHTRGSGAGAGAGAAAAPLPIGSRVALTGLTPEGDPLVETA